MHHTLICAQCFRKFLKYMLQNIIRIKHIIGKNCEILSAFDSKLAFGVYVFPAYAIGNNFTQLCKYTFFLKARDGERRGKNSLNFFHASMFFFQFLKFERIQLPPERHLTSCVKEKQTRDFKHFVCSLFPTPFFLKEC